jgi:hypothetical protein
MGTPLLLALPRDAQHVTGAFVRLSVCLAGSLVAHAYVCAQLMEFLLKNLPRFGGAAPTKFTLSISAPAGKGEQSGEGRKRGKARCVAHGGVQRG